MPVSVLDHEKGAIRSQDIASGPYEILAAIGEGGMGEVYRARHSKLGREAI